MIYIDPKRQKEIGAYMSERNWVAECNRWSNLWVIAKEPYAYSNGPFEVLAMGKTLEEAFDKAKEQEKATV